MQRFTSILCLWQCIYILQTPQYPMPCRKWNISNLKLGEKWHIHSCNYSTKQNKNRIINDYWGFFCSVRVHWHGYTYNMENMQPYVIHMGYRMEISLLCCIYFFTNPPDGLKTGLWKTPSNLAFILFTGPIKGRNLCKMGHKNIMA